MCRGLPGQPGRFCILHPASSGAARAGTRRAGAAAWPALCGAGRARTEAGGGAEGVLLSLPAGTSLLPSPAPAPLPARVSPWVWAASLSAPVLMLPNGGRRGRILRWEAPSVRWGEGEAERIVLALRSPCHFPPPPPRCELEANSPQGWPRRALGGSGHRQTRRVLRNYLALTFAVLVVVCVTHELRCCARRPRKAQTETRAPGQRCLLLPEGFHQYPGSEQDTFLRAAERAHAWDRSFRETGGGAVQRHFQVFRVSLLVRGYTNTKLEGSGGVVWVRASPSSAGHAQS